MAALHPGSVSRRAFTRAFFGYNSCLVYWLHDQVRQIGLRVGLPYRP